MSVYSQSTGSPMSYVTEAELVEIVPDLRAMARVEASAEVCAALNRLADRYAAMADECQDLEQVTHDESAALVRSLPVTRTGTGGPLDDRPPWPRQHHDDVLAYDGRV